MSIKTRSLWSALGILLFVGFTFFLFVLYIIPGMLQIFTKRPEIDTTPSVWLMWTPIIGYLLISVNLCLINKYLSPSTTWVNLGLLQGLLVSLIWGFAASFIWGMIVLFGGFDNGLVMSLKGLSAILITCLIIGFIWGMILSIVGGFRS